MGAGRISIVSNDSLALLNALTIGCRFAAIRRQFPLKSNIPETPILEYQSVQYRLIPKIGAMLVFRWVGVDLSNMWVDKLRQFQNGDTKALNEMHSIISAVKPFASWDILDSVKEIRHLMGGLGYSKYSRLGSMMNDLGSIKLLI